MKATAVFGMLALLAEAAVIERRQEHAHSGGAMAPMPKVAPPPPTTKSGIRTAYKIEHLAPQILPEAKRVKITYGPYKLRGTESKINPGNGPPLDPAGTAYSDALGPDFPRDILVLSTNSILVNDTFQKAYVTDGYYNHHAAFISYEKRGVNWFTCNDKPVPDMTPFTIFMGSEAEEVVIPLTENSNKVKSGFYIGPKDNLFHGIEIVNYNKDDRVVYTVSEVEYLPGMPAGFVHGESRQIPMGVCDGDEKSWAASYSVHAPAGQKKFVLSGKNDMVIAKDGYLRTVYSHLHDGGAKMLLTLNGKEVCSTSPIYGGVGHEQVQPNGEVLKKIAKTIGCADPLRVHKGDKMQLFAYFDFEQHPARQFVTGEESESMAFGLMTFVPDL